MSTVVIITGHTKGLGAAICSQYLRDGHSVLGISRSDAALHPRLTQWRGDLCDATAVADRLRQWLLELEPRPAKIRLINNAITVPQAAPLHKLETREIVNVVRSGLEAPALLCAAFLYATEQWVATGWHGDHRVLNISSGLGRKAMASVGTYCAVKAGMDHLTRALALDQAQAAVGTGLRVASLAPGVVDTEMQTQLRGSDLEQFPGVGVFQQLHQNGQLSTPENAAAKCVFFLESDDFGTEVIADVRDVTISTGST